MVDVDIKEGKTAVPFGFHNELNVPMDTVQVLKELQQLAWTMMMTYDDCVVHVVKAALWITPSRAISSKCFVKKWTMTGDSGEPMVTPSVFS
jgi:hypothetical protein